MKSIERTETFDAPTGKVFRCIDDLAVTGMHMNRSSVMMMGSKLHLQYLTEKKEGTGTKYRWTGKIMGIPLDFTVEVTKWIDGKEKVWETIGQPKMIIFSWYRMDLTISPVDDYCTKAALSVTYEKPKGFINKILCILLADWYCRWCLKKMLGDAKKMLSG
ncbi:SRPBCC family protein [Chitinophaga oryzae]|uniref:SRPBCC family protein n=1 Tax=Chitinophaga oryzae TaxID=2725414 RepID=A0ABX6LAX6_9BACT|nr:SRPBCC family protein [Chitinophaga oryzae]QJB37246.1 SRPBCC family protein [Chitinophaga oryzae]